jgi:hypothetical protein
MNKAAKRNARARAAKKKCAEEPTQEQQTGGSESVPRSDVDAVFPDHQVETLTPDRAAGGADGGYLRRDITIFEFLEMTERFLNPDRIKSCGQCLATCMLRGPSQLHLRKYTSRYFQLRAAARSLAAWVAGNPNAESDDNARALLDWTIETFHDGGAFGASRAHWLSLDTTVAVVREPFKTSASSPSCMMMFDDWALLENGRNT